MVLDEAAFVARLASPRAEPALELCQRSFPAAELDEDAPYDGGRVQPHDARPA